MKQLLLFLLFGALPLALGAQEADEEPPLPIETFKTQRLVNGYSAEPVFKGEMVLTFSHRFAGPLTRGFKNFFGFDDYADIRFALAYGFTERLSVELGRTRTGQVYDGNFKYKLLRQSAEGMPFTLSVLGSAALMSADFPPNQESSLSFKHRMRYLTQVLAARQFNDRLSVQMMPAWVHRNLAEKSGEENNTFLFGVGGRVRITRIMHLSIEYFQPLNNKTRDVVSLQPVTGFSVDFITQRHAFQITVSNNRLLLDQEYLTQTTQDFFDHKGLLIGFHITRNFF